MPRARIAAILIAALVLVGCGSEPQRPPDMGAVAPAGTFSPLALADQAVRLRIPGAWRLTREAGDGPLLATITSGRATIAVWRFERTEPLPRTKNDLEATKESLVAAVVARDPEYTVTASRILRGVARRGVELIGTGSNQGFERRGRSLHLFAGGAEVVLDQYTTPEQFATVDGTVFREVARSLRADPSGA